MQKVKIGFIGAGNMAQAIIKGMVDNGGFSAGQITLFDVDSQKCAAFAAKGMNIQSNVSEVVTASDVIFLAVKPQNYSEVLQGIRQAVSKEKIFVSIAAGISISFITRELGMDCPVIRAMPNTPLLIGKGATALCRADNVTDEDFRCIEEIFGASGETAVLTEDKMNAIIAVNGSSPAYVYLFAKAILDYAASQGIDPQAALLLTCKTLEGSAGMLRESGYTPDELIKMVSSPGGTTLKALEALEEKGFYQALMEAMDRCTRRAEEVGR